MLGVFGVIIVGTALLMLPVSNKSGEWGNPMDALFTAVSATCVTGLVTVDTALTWTVFGQTVILLLIQIGGLGFMTMAVALTVLVRRSITPKEKMMIVTSYNLNSFESMKKLLLVIFSGTVIIELLGAAMLSTQFIPEFGLWDGMFKSLFHSVSAFCNAGFDLMGEKSGAFSSLVYFRSNTVVNITIILLIFLGSVGFIVWSEFVDLIRNKRRMSAYSKLVLTVSLILVFGGAAIFFAAEYNNPATMGELSLKEKILASLFESATLRTAGFSSIDNAAMTGISKFVALIFMLIGGGSGSTAGGVKVGTISILLLVVWNSAKNKRDALVFKRRITPDQFIRAATVIIIQIFGIIISTAVMLVSNPGLDTLAAAFETTSAIDTVGLSFGITPNLSVVGLVTNMVLMYFGRVGILSIMFAIISDKDSNPPVSYPDANMLVG